MSRTRRNPPMFQILPDVYRVGFMFAFIWRKDDDSKRPWQWFVRQGVAGEATSKEAAYRAVKAVHDQAAPERAATHVLGALFGELRMLAAERKTPAVTKVRALRRILANLERDAHHLWR